jgi:hypothetical protein
MASPNSRHDGIELLGQVLVPWRHQNYSRSRSSIGSMWSGGHDTNSSAENEFELRSLNSKSKDDDGAVDGPEGDTSNRVANSGDIIERRRISRDGSST